MMKMEYQLRNMMNSMLKIQKTELSKQNKIITLIKLKNYRMNLMLIFKNMEKNKKHKNKSNQ